MSYWSNITVAMLSTHLVPMHANNTGCNIITMLQDITVCHDHNNYVLTMAYSAFSPLTGQNKFPKTRKFSSIRNGMGIEG